MINQYWWSIYRLVLGSNKAQTAEAGGHFSQSLVGGSSRRPVGKSTDREDIKPSPFFSMSREFFNPTTRVAGHHMERGEKLLGKQCPSTRGVLGANKHRAGVQGETGSSRCHEI